MPTLREELDAAVGPAPDPVTPYRLLGFPLNGDSVRRYEQEKQKYDALVSQAVHALTPQVLNPLRGATLGQIADISGRDPLDLATPGQINMRQEQFQSPDPNVMSRHPARLQDPQGPPDLRTKDLSLPYSGETNDAGNRQLVYPPAGMTREPVATPPVRFLSPPDTQIREANLEAPSTREQQMLGMSGLTRESKWQPQGRYGAGGSAFQQRYKVILDAYGQDAADSWAAEGVLPGGLKANNLDARTQSSLARRDNLGSQTTGQDIRNENLPRQYEDQHRNIDSQIGARDNLAAHRDRLYQIQRSNADAMRAATSNKDWLALERLNEQRHWHDTLSTIAGAVDKNDIHTSEEQAAYKEALDIIQNMTHRDPTPEEMGFLERVFGGKPRAKVTPRGPLGPPVGALTGATSRPSTQPQTPQSPVTPQPQPQRNSFNDAPPGSRPGQVLNKGGKPVADWDGQQWVPR